MPPPLMKPSFFDIGTGEAYADAAWAAAWVIDQLASSAEIFAEWVDEHTGAEVSVGLRARGEGSATIWFEAEGVYGEIALSVDASGWIAANYGGVRAWIDRPYEELDLWPENTAARASEAPGRIGKRMNWLSLDAKAWPVLAPLANPHGWVNLRIRE